LTAFVILRRRNHRRYGSLDLLPRGFTSIVGSVAFGLAAAGQLFLGVVPLPLGQSAGTGEMLAGGIIALLVFLGFVVRLAREIQPRPAD
jgi:hypothetical protein